MGANGQLTRTLQRLGGVLQLCLALAAPAGSQSFGQTGPATINQVGSPANNVPLIGPAGVAFDSKGNLLFAETGSHVIRMVSPAGVLTTFAGNGTQGFAGDHGPAARATLDSPSAVAVDSADNVYLADTHNHRIRRVDALTATITTYAGNGIPGLGSDGGPADAQAIDLPVAIAFDSAQNLYFADARAHVIRRIDHLTTQVTTVAGTGIQGFSGDGGPATAAAIDSPDGLAFNSAGDLYLSDTRNQRIRRVDHVTGRITTVAGAGAKGFSGDGSAATRATLALPRGLAFDSTGNLYLVDSANHRIRQVGAASGQITTIAGDGTQGMLGDGSAATSANLDSPGSIALSAGARPVFSDRANGRLREIDAAGNILTYAGLGSSPAISLVLSGPAVVPYGSGSLTAKLQSSSATGLIDLFQVLPGGLSPLATMPLAGGSATFPVSSLSAGSYRLEATYAGDSTHGAAQSDLLAVSVSRAPAQATITGSSILYGQPLPTLVSTLDGILSQDAGKVSLMLSPILATRPAAGDYPITASLIGPSAGNYTLAQNPAVLSVGRAPVTAALTQQLTVHVASTTTGTPAGTATLLDGINPAGDVPLSSGGDATFDSGSLSSGSHNLTVRYSGDVNFLPVTSNSIVAVVPPAATADFMLASSGGTQTVAAGSPATFAFTVTPVNGALASAIQLAVSGLPPGATASFNPAYLPPTSAVAPFSLTILTARASVAHSSSLTPRIPLALFGVLLPMAALARKRKHFVLIALLVLPLGCGDRVRGSATAPGTASYTLTVTATATSTSGAVLVHTTAVNLNVK